MDLLYGDHSNAKTLNQTFDKIAKKNGLGTNLNDSDQVVKPLYREVLIKSSLARSISSYLWAAVGVALAVQKPWEEYFKNATLKFWTPKFYRSIHNLGKSFVDSAKQLLNPLHPRTLTDKHCGKFLVGVASAATILGIIHSVNIKKKPSNVEESDVIDKNQESVVG